MIAVHWARKSPSQRTHSPRRKGYGHLNSQVKYYVGTSTKEGLTGSCSKLCILKQRSQKPGSNGQRKTVEGTLAGGQHEQRNGAMNAYSIFREVRQDHWRGMRPERRVRQGHERNSDFILWAGGKQQVSGKWEQHTYSLNSYLWIGSACSSIKS